MTLSMEQEPLLEPSSLRWEVLRASVARELTVYRRDLRVVILLVVLPLAMLLLVGSGLAPDFPARVRDIRLSVTGPGAERGVEALRKAGFTADARDEAASADPFRRPHARVMVDAGLGLTRLELSDVDQPIAPALSASVRVALANVRPGGTVQPVIRTPYDVAVPGLALTFGFMLVPILAANLARESLNGTWPRLLVLPVSRGWALAGKLGVHVLFFVAQLWLLIGVGRLVWGAGGGMGLDALPRVTAVGLASGTVAAGLGLLVASRARSLPAISQFATLVTFVPAAIGGALVALPFLPPAVRTVAPLTPIYWAVHEVRASLYGMVDWPQSALRIGVLAAFGVALLAFGLTRLPRAEFRFDA